MKLSYLNRIFLAIAILQICFVTLAHSQIVYSYDASGNPTNAVLSTTTPLSSVVTNSSQNLALGEQLSLNVMAGGSGVVTYQWQLNGVNIAGATNASFNVVNVATTNAGAYSVVASIGSVSQTNQLGNVCVFATSNTLNSVAYGVSQFVAVGTNGTIVGSSNLISFISFNSGTTNSLNGIVYGNNLFVAVGMAGTVLTSTNGTAWVLHSVGTNNLNGVTFGNGIFVAVGSGGVTMTSRNGTNWTQQTFSNPTLEAIAFGNNHFIAVGTAGTIWSSPDGTNWSGQSISTTGTINTVTYGNGMFVVAGTGGVILSSTTGSNWVFQTSGTIENFASLAFFNNTFFAIGPVGQNFLSTNGINWSESAAGTFTPLYGATVGNNILVAAGEDGFVMKIPYGLLDHFAWNSISTPQRVNQSFAATIVAQDAANNTATNFNGTAILSAASCVTAASNTLLGNVVPAYTNTGSVTFGNYFTPNANLLVTQVRHYDIAQLVCIWDQWGDLLASINVTNNPGNWVTTSVPVPLILTAGDSYIISAYNGNSTNASYYYRQDGSNSFANGTIDQAFVIPTNACPQIPSSAFWYLVDLGYTVLDTQSNTITPTTVNFVNGTATFNATLPNSGQGMTLTATDSFAHSGSSNPFNVYGTNDVAVNLISSTNQVAVQSNLTYTITVVNSGPTAATGVNVTNTLPANVNFVSASSTQGTCQYTSGTVTCNLGTLANLSTATITIVVAPTVSGVVLTNVVNVMESGTDPNLSNNTSTNVVYVPPTLSIGDLIVSKGNTGLSQAQIPITLSSPSVLSIQLSFTTLNGTNSNPAIAGEDYVPTNGIIFVPPGTNNVTLPIGIQGNTILSSTKQFLVQLYSPFNATLTKSLGAITILNLNGTPGQLYSFAWTNIPSPQRTNLPFAVSISALDSSGIIASNYTSPISLKGININGPTSNTLLPNSVAESSANNTILTVGYAFIPTNDIYVTHVRSYAGTKVSIWTSTGFLVASQPISSVPGTWVETPLTTPIWLSASNTYVIGVFTGGSTYYWRQDGANIFANGQITQGYSSLGDTFPMNIDAAQWYLVDLRYVLGAAISPTNTGNVVNGVWTGNVTSQELGTNFMFLATDNNGHFGYSNPFGVYQTNDLAVTLGNSPSTALVGTNLIYTVMVLNPGPNASTGVLVTNQLPSGTTFVSATTSQGTCSQLSGVVTANLGTIPALSSATVTITVLPTVAGLPLTNSVTATRNEPDANLSNNSAVSIIIPNQTLSLQLANALSYSSTPWMSGGNALWQIETNITYNSTNAAQSGSIIDSQQTWIQTSVYGPGTLSFWWKVSSQAGGDYLDFITNGIVVTNISGSVNWTQVNFNVAPGNNVLQWKYIKDGSISSGSDAGWLDQVVYTIPTISLSTPSVTNRTFVFTVNAGVGQKIVFQSSTNLLQWTPISTNTATNGVFNITDKSFTNAPYQYYRALLLKQ